MRASLTGLPLVLGLCLPSLAWAGGTAGIPPLVSKGVDAKVVNNVTGLLSSELDFSGAYDTVQDMPASAALTVACLTQAPCLQGVAKAAGVDALLTGSIGTGPKGLQIYLVLYDATKNVIVRKKTFDMGADVSALAENAPKMVKEILGQGAPQTAEAKAAASPNFEESDEEDFQMASKPAASTASKTKITVQAKPGELEDEIDPEEEAQAERDRQAEAKAKADAEKRAREEQARKAREEQERVAREEQARKAREDQARRDREEAARRAEAERLAQEEEERQAREDEARRQRAAADARAREATAAKSKAKAPPPPAAEEEEEDLSDELASFSFGDSSTAIAVDGESSEETPRSFSEKYGAETAPAAKKTAPPAKRTTVTARRVEEIDEDEELEPEGEAEESPDFDEEDAKPSTRRASRDEDEDTRRSSRSRRTPDFGEEGTKRRTAFDDEPAKAKVALAGRIGYAKYDVFNFVTYGAEITVPVVESVVIAAGIEGFSTQRHLTDEAMKEISQETGLLPAEINPDPWNTILPINVGVQYKGGKHKVHPYAGVDLTMTPYSSDFDLAFGARARGGVDLLVADNFGFNLNVGLGFMSGDKFELTESGVGNMGFLPQASLGTLVAF